MKNATEAGIQSAEGALKAAEAKEEAALKSKNRIQEADENLVSRDNKSNAEIGVQVALKPASPWPKSEFNAAPRCGAGRAEDRDSQPHAAARGNADREDEAQEPDRRLRLQQGHSHRRHRRPAQTRDDGRERGRRSTSPRRPTKCRRS